MGDGARPLLVDRPAADVLRVRLNREARHNAVDSALLEALEAAFSRPRANAVVLGSATPGQFCSGADMSITDAERAAVSAGLYELYRKMREVDVPVVAAISGPAVGGGAQLAIACDLRIAAPGAWLQIVGPAHGLAVGAWALPSLIGRGRALDLCLSGRRVSAEEALSIGLVNRVTDDPDMAAVELARALSALDRSAVTRVKRLVEHASDPAAALELEACGNAGWQGALPEPG